MTAAALPSKFATIVRLTLLELWRQRLAFAPIAIAVVMAVIAVTFANAGDKAAPLLLSQSRELAQGVYGMLGFLGTLLGLLAGAGLVSTEIERGTVLLLAIKPLPRWLLMLGKAVGAFAFLLASFALWGVFLLIQAWLHMPGMPLGALFIGLLLSTLVPILFAAVALFYSTFLPTMGAAAAALFTWVAASIAPNLIVLEQDPHTAWAGYLADGISRVLPLDALRTLAIALPFGDGLTRAQGLELLTIPGWIVLAMVVFQRRNLG
ncbi:MAG TPA: ABC transporter permease subunit [Oscillatoriaceae cyanobacterium]